MTALFAFSGHKLPTDVQRDPAPLIERFAPTERCGEVLNSALAWDRDQRWPSMGVFRAELKKSLATPPPTPEPGEVFHNPVDGMELVYVPAALYTLGDYHKDNEQPVHTVRLSAFWIGKDPVTNRQYRRFLETNPEFREPQYWRDPKFNGEDQPVVGIDWYEARAYCRWAGLELPTEAQWEAAARGTDRRLYPWGYTRLTSTLCNFGGHAGKTLPVGSFDTEGPFGTRDQIGNVWEWCLDTWKERAYDGRDGAEDPAIQDEDPEAPRCMRGGAWWDEPHSLYVSFRGSSRPDVRVNAVGFRCALPAGSF